MVTGVPSALAPSAARPGVTRAERLGAAFLDALALLPPLALAALLAVAWLLTRTAWGRDDPSSLDSSVALALLAAGPAVWLARLGYAAVTAHATPGQHARGLTVVARGERVEGLHPVARAARLLLHPFGAVGWALLAFTLLLAGAWPLAAVTGTVALFTLFGGLGSLVAILVAPDARGLHDRLAGTRVVRS